MDSKWLVFDLILREKDRKTDRWLVNKKETEELLGEVRWFGRWRQYCYFPEPGVDVVLAASCLEDLAEFIQKRMQERRVR